MKNVLLAATAVAVWLGSSPAFAADTTIPSTDPITFSVKVGNEIATFKNTFANRVSVSTPVVGLRLDYDTRPSWGGGLILGGGIGADVPFGGKGEASVFSFCQPTDIYGYCAGNGLKADSIKERVAFDALLHVGYQLGDRATIIAEFGAKCSIAHWSSRYNYNGIYNNYEYSVTSNFCGPDIGVQVNYEALSWLGVGIDLDYANLAATSARSTNSQPYAATENALTGSIQFTIPL